MRSFHEVRFPVDISLASSGGPERRTDIVLLGSGRESRNARWHHARRRYEAGYGITTLDALAAAVAFFEERRGRLYGFRWRDRLDFKSCLPSQEPAPTDQAIGTGDGERANFQLVKQYGGAHAPYVRPIAKPVEGSVRVAVAGQELTAGLDFTCDATTGLVTFAEGRIPAPDTAVTAGYLFDVPVRFDTDRLEVDFAAFSAGAIPQLPVIEIVP
jgi:TIGR02217 family protein